MKAFSDTFSVQTFCPARFLVKQNKKEPAVPLNDEQHAPRRQLLDRLSPVFGKKIYSCAVGPWEPDPSLRERCAVMYCTQPHARAL